jgi:hypothetical protein
MPIKIRQLGPCFAGEVGGIDMRTPLTRAEVAEIHAGMDESQDRRRATGDRGFWRNAIKQAGHVRPQ